MKFLRFSTVLLLAGAVVPAMFATAAEPFREVLSLGPELANSATIALETRTRSASPDELRAIEARLLDTLLDPAATPDCRRWVCRQLRYAGTDRCAAAVAPLLLKDEFSVEARFALQGIPGARVDAVLREAISSARGASLAGLLQTLGARASDRTAVALIAPLAAGDAASAALFALGRIGGPEAMKALLDAAPPAGAREERWRAALRCAEGADRETAGTVCRRAFQESGEASTRVAALRAWLASGAPDASGAVMEALKGTNSLLRAGAAQSVCELGRFDLFGPALAGLLGMPVDVQAVILARVPGPLAQTTLLAVLDGKEPWLRLVALEALGRVGTEAAVPALLAAAASADKAEQAAARESLTLIPGRAASAALARSSGAGAPGLRREALQALAKRSRVEAIPAVLAAAQAEDAGLRAAAVTLLGQIGGVAELPRLARWVAEAPDAAGREAAESAAIAVCQRVPVAEAAGPFLAALDAPAASPGARAALVGVVGQIHSPAALLALRARLADADPAVRAAALRGLSDWEDSGPREELLRVAKASTNTLEKETALRGYARMILMPPARPEQMVQGLRDAMGAAVSPAQKRLVLAALGQVAHRDAAELAFSCLSQAELEMDAATAVAGVAKRLRQSDPDASADLLERVAAEARTPAARAVAAGAGGSLAGMVSIASEGVASSPDGLERDGAAGGDDAAIDGNPATYWDEKDGAALYRLAVTFREPRPVSAISITGYQHQNFAPKDFEVRCDGKAIQKVKGARYEENFFVLPFAETSCKTVELYITGSYGASPAIRELGIYRKSARAAALPAKYRVLVFSKTLGFRHSSIGPGVAALRALGRTNGFAVDATEESGVFTRTNLARYKAVVFLSVTGDVLDSNQEAALKEYVTGGGGFAAVHGALHGSQACEGDWPWYGELTCASFSNHSAVVLARVDAEDSKNPSMAGLPARWYRTDEWYNYGIGPRGRAHIVATVDESTYRGGGNGADHPMAWCSRMGDGRVWYTAMGHTDSSFQEPLFLRHLLGGIELVAGLKPADFSVNSAPARSAGTGLVTSETGNSRWRVDFDGRPVCEYVYGEDQIKPYVRELRTLRGENLLRDSPSDHKHHHALMYAIKVNDVNFWEETPGCGHQRVGGQARQALEAGPDGRRQAVLRQRLFWTKPPGVAGLVLEDLALLVEDRTLTVSVDPRSGEVALRWQGRFQVGRAAGAEAVLTGANYHGLGARFLAELDAPATHWIGGRALGLAGTAQDLSRAAWGAVVFPLPEAPATIAFFGAPSHPGGEPMFFSMKQPFAYISATQALDKTPVVHKAGETWSVDYLVATYPEAASAGALKERAARFAAESARP